MMCGKCIKGELIFLRELEESHGDYEIRVYDEFICNYCDNEMVIEVGYARKD